MKAALGQRSSAGTAQIAFAGAPRREKNTPERDAPPILSSVDGAQFGAQNSLKQQKNIAFHALAKTVNKPTGQAAATSGGVSFLQQRQRLFGDVEFVNRQLARNHQLVLDGKGNARFFADLAQWEDLQTEQEEVASPLVNELPSIKENKPGLSKQESKELKNIEVGIRKAEEERNQASLALTDSSVASDAAELMKRQETLDAAETKIETLLKRWEELEAKRK